MIGLLLLCVFVCVKATDYCNMKSCTKGKHTMCNFPKPGPGKHCSDYVNAMSTERAEKLLHAHNDFRNKWAGGKWPNQGDFPKAADMLQMYWGDEIATIAQRHADQCVFEHDKCRNIGKYYVGQNLGIQRMSGGKEPDEDVNSVTDWIDEYKYYPASKISSFDSNAGNGQMVGHFTQCVWAGSYRLGCGETKYSENEWTTRFVVCNYGPGGNMLRDALYTPGEPCSKCPKGFKCGEDPRYPNLCGNKSLVVTPGKIKKNFGTSQTNVLLPEPWCFSLLFNLIMVNIYFGLY